jgi:hypothetical protein
MNLLKQDVETPSSWFREWPSQQFEGPVLECSLKNHAPGQVLCLVNGKESPLAPIFYSQQSSFNAFFFSTHFPWTSTPSSKTTVWNQDQGFPFCSLEFSPCGKVSPPFNLANQSSQSLNGTCLIWD